MEDHLSRNDEILRLVADDNINRAISRLLDFVRDFCSDQHLQKETLLISANHKKLMREERQNLIDYNAANQIRSRIINQILSVAKEICNDLNKSNTGIERAPEHVKKVALAQEELSTRAENKSDNIVKDIPTEVTQENPQPEKVEPEIIEKVESPKEEVVTPIQKIGDTTFKKTTSDRSASSSSSSNPNGKGKKSVCRISNLNKKYSKSGFELKGINVEIDTNEILGVVGENGNGKTTFFRILAGELHHDSGLINFPFFGEENTSNVDWIKVKNKIAYVKQELPKWNGSLKQNLQYEAAIHGIKGQQNIDDVDFILHRLGLVEYQDRNWKELSGGYKLRFALAKALVWKPSLLILDEPLANLDIHAQLLVLNDLRDMANSIRYPVSIVISSQHLHEVEHISDKILFIRNGSPIFFGLKKDLGKDRNENFFEIQTEASKEELTEALRNIKLVDIVFDGLYFQIITDRSVKSDQLIKELIANQIKIKYFRDISQSTKKLFI